MLKLGSARRHRFAAYAPALALLLAGVRIAIDFDTWIELDGEGRLSGWWLQRR